jgi:transcriptional regulator GlxA family with amidase domain
MRGKPVSTRRREKLSSEEHKAIAIIRAWRASPGDNVHAHLLNNPAEAMQNLILGSSGNAKLHFAPIAAELGLAMRTLQRAFVKQYQTTMRDFQTETRLAAAQHMLRVMPADKISVIANHLGYDAEQDFIRFYEKLVHESPAKWAKREREEAARIAKRLRNGEE